MPSVGVFPEISVASSAADSMQTQSSAMNAGGSQGSFASIMNQALSTPASSSTVAAASSSNRSQSSESSGAPSSQASSSSASSSSTSNSTSTNNSSSQATSAATASTKANSGAGGASTAKAQSSASQAGSAAGSANAANATSGKNAGVQKSSAEGLDPKVSLPSSIGLAGTLANSGAADTKGSKAPGDTKKKQTDAPGTTTLSGCGAPQVSALASGVIAAETAAQANGGNVVVAALSARVDGKSATADGGSSKSARPVSAAVLTSATTASALLKNLSAQNGAVASDGKSPVPQDAKGDAQAVLADAAQGSGSSQTEPAHGVSKGEDAASAPLAGKVRASDLSTVGSPLLAGAETDGKLTSKLNLKADGAASVSGALSSGLLHAGVADAHAAATTSEISVPAAPVQAASAPVAANPYARLDEASAPALLRLTPQNMTVAVTDPTLGNVQVQAQSVNGQIIASMATANATAHAQLSGHIASLNGFLHEQNVNVMQLTLSRQQLSGGMGGGQGSAQGGNAGDSAAQQQSSAQTFSADNRQAQAMPAAEGISRAASAAEVRSSAASLSFSYIDLHA